MAWKKVLGNINKDEKEEVVDPEKKPDENKDKPPEKSPAELIAESLKPITDGFAALRAEFDELKVKTTPKDKREVASVLDNEDEAFNQRLTPIMERQLTTEARIARDDVEREYRAQGYGDLWDENRKEINKSLDETQLVTVNTKGETVILRGNPEYIHNVADMMIGRAVKKGGVKYAKEGDKGSFFLEDATGDETVITRREKANEGITKSQLRAAERFGIDIKDYKKSASKLKFVDRGEKIERSA